MAAESGSAGRDGHSLARSGAGTGEIPADADLVRVPAERGHAGLAGRRMGAGRRVG